MSAAAEVLRRYLRQRMELGETELVLDRFAPDALEALLRGGAPADSPLRPPAQPAPRRRAESVGADLPASAASAPAAPREERAAGELRRVRIGAPPGDAASAGTLDELREMALPCVGCALCEGRTQVVFGEGDPRARIMVVGEAPGAEEDRSGRPFVGRAGKLLDRFLESIGSPRESVYICNVLKCRPPGNRNPRPEEIEACSGYLRRQVELVDPEVILAVGTFPAQTLLGTDEPIGRLRGRVHEYGGRPLVPTYHPAAVLRNPSWIRPVWDDLQRLREVLSSA